MADFYQQVTVVVDQTYRQVSLQALFEYVEQQQAAFKVFYKNEATLHFQAQLTESMRQLMQDYVAKRYNQTSQADQIEMSITIDYLAVASLALVFKWVNDGLCIHHATWLRCYTNWYKHLIRRLMSHNFLSRRNKALTRPVIFDII
ncbi:TetR-like C-terminal domain-containing protein [Latilactobacillus curvatus]|uniref:TetR-like C-terminal domain-containing protein n=1 Tax=Latilactobacillus curvatus TaxID=28038 RepID=UPI0020A5E960|nr:TetR-like C-terminal domain-containing protein [Latilactobacillus curvatus]UTC11868.1 hypothetical protein A4W75_01770 [Latilactobacillus curvatus]